MPLFDGDQTVIDPEKDYYPELVGEGKKYADNKALARSKMEGDAHIARLEAETAELRSKVNQQITLQSVLDQIRTTRSSEPSEPDNQDNLEDRRDPQNQNNNLTPKDVEALLDKALTSREDKSRKAANRGEVERKSIEAFGPNWRSVLNKKREELGLGEQFLTDLAETQPSAFLKLLDVRPKENSLFNEAPPTNKLNSQLVTDKGKVKNFKYYQDGKKQFGQQWFDDRTYEMMQVSAELGDDFYK